MSTRPFSRALWLALAMVTGCSGSAPATVPDPDVEAPVPAVWWPASPPRDRWFPVAALALPTGELMIAETGQNRLYRLVTRDAEPIRLPAPGRPTITWTALSAAPGLSVYALDGLARVIHQYDFQGNYLGLALDLEQVAAEQELGPVEPGGFAADRSGQALVTDRLGDRVLVFGPGWSFLGVWGQTGSDPGSWRRPGAVAVGSKGPFLVADEGNQRAVLLDVLGEVLAVRELTEPPRGVAVLGNGRFAVSHGQVIEVLDGALDLIETHALPLVPGCEGKPFVTTSLAGTVEHLFVGEGCSGRVLEVHPGGD